MVKMGGAGGEGFNNLVVYRCIQSVVIFSYSSFLILSSLCCVESFEIRGFLSAYVRFLWFFVAL